MDKAERIYQELLQGKVGIWYVSDGYGSKIMIKIPSSTLKSVIKGCRLELTFGRDDKIFHVGFKVYDDKINFLTVSCIQKNRDEHFSIAKIMNLNKVQIQLCNELGVCQAFGDIALSDENKNDVLCILGNPKRLYCGNYNDKLDISADNFQYSLGLDHNFISPKKIDTLSFEVKIENLESLNNIFIRDTAYISTEISDPDEGKLLEKEVFITLNSLFEPNIYLSPQVENIKGNREFTDVLAFSDFGIFLIESKALGVNNVTKERSMERKVKGLQKQVEKAIKQLVGAYKIMIAEKPIYSISGEQIHFDRTLPPCGIILISELIPFGNWDDILLMLLKAMSENGVLLHLMDLNELMQFIGHSKGDKNLFDYYLFERLKNFVENPVIFQQTKFVKSKD